MPEPPISRAGNVNLQVFGDDQKLPHRRDGPATVSNSHYGWCIQAEYREGGFVVTGRPTIAWSPNGQVEWN